MPLRMALARACGCSCRSSTERRTRYGNPRRAALVKEQDMRFHQVIRRLAHMPLFTSVAVLTLAIAIGANTAIFSVIEGVLLKPLPYPRSDELVVVDHAAPGMNIASAGAAPFQYFSY